jgi:hypothetical protein
LKKSPRLFCRDSNGLRLRAAYDKAIDKEQFKDLREK